MLREKAKRIRADYSLHAKKKKTKKKKNKPKKIWETNSQKCTMNAIL